MADVTQGRVDGHRIVVRHPEHDFWSGVGGPDVDGRYFAAGDPVSSHVMAVLSALFPEGEEFFIRSVRRFRDQVDDPVLRRQVAGFIGQEAVHGREHREFNDRLAQLGYPTRLVDVCTGRGLRLLEKVVPGEVSLAVTAALEHYTATLAELLLTDPEFVDDRFFEDDVRRLFLWHAIEECEHRSVAFDVFTAVVDDERVRVRVMHATTVVFLSVVTGASVLSLALDRNSWTSPGRVLASARRLFRSPLLSVQMVRRIREYNRRGFHPEDRDVSDLLDWWRAELFPEPVPV